VLVRRIARPGRPKSTYVCIHGRAGETNKLQENEKYLETCGLDTPLQEHFDKLNVAYSGLLDHWQQELNLMVSGD
jgi:hypothetical protein